MRDIIIDFEAPCEVFHADGHTVVLTYALINPKLEMSKVSGYNPKLSLVINGKNTETRSDAELAIHAPLNTSCQEEEDEAIKKGYIFLAHTNTGSKKDKVFIKYRVVAKRSLKATFKECYQNFIFTDDENYAIPLEKDILFLEKYFPELVI